MINKQEFSNDLLAWYDEYKRELAWRSDPTPYHVWVSEIMLQQTRVEAVKGYYKRFLEKLPRLIDLANAQDDELHKLWEGLGYYNRVRNMKKCAQVCVETYDAQLPSTYEELLKLPGIGSYTAGAIASIAYKEAVPAVDGNVLRVFSRIVISYDDILKEATKKKFQHIIQEYIPINRPDAFNQALMEIGALICVPNAAPRCNICPLSKHCEGYKQGVAQQLPIKASKKKRKIEKKTILVIATKSEVVLSQREDKGLLANLYEFPSMDGYHTKKEVEACVSTSYDIHNIIKLQSAKHIFSHIEWHMQGYLIEVSDVKHATLSATQKEIALTYAIPTAFKVYKDAVLTYWKV